MTWFSTLLVILPPYLLVYLGQKSSSWFKFNEFKFSKTIFFENSLLIEIMETSGDIRNNISSVGEADEQQ